ncbi:MAG: hypothetical protein Q8N47_20010 [Bryobacterales bacterium]|nr:hypothetical protein [Bryobacterales bacterium]
MRVGLLAYQILAVASAMAATDVAITVADESPYHTHVPGQKFRVLVRHDYSGAGQIRGQWRDFRGTRLGDPVRLAQSQTTSLEAPSGDIGYYGLYFDSDDPSVVFNRNTGLRREFGFAVLPSTWLFERGTKPGSAFGLVHADINDPYLHPGYIKTLTLQQFSDDSSWVARMQERRGRGLIEVPLQSSPAWRGDSTRPISAYDLTVRAAEMKRAFAADPATLYWELGLEENLWPGSNGAYYWQNLAAKFAAVRSAAGQVNPDIRLAYQIEGFDYDFFRAFFDGPAATHADVLALHPYRWRDDFPSPETWLGDYLNNVRRMMRRREEVRRIWITEVGAPVRGNPDPVGFFGYPQSGVAVKGQTRDANAAYLIKVHVLALSLGVEKLFWFNYRDRGADPTFVEDHFGLVDYWGYPKPAYAAYAQLIQRLDGKRFSRRFELPEGVQVYEFTGELEDCFVMWSFPESSQRVMLDCLGPGIGTERVVSVTSAVGSPLAVAGTALTVTGMPVFAAVSK